MNLLNRNKLYSIPDEKGSVYGCSLNTSVINYLIKHYNHDNFKHIPNTLTSLITTYTNEFFGCIIEFETRYRKLRHKFKSKIFSFLIVGGTYCFYGAYDKWDNDCL